MSEAGLLLGAELLLEKPREEAGAGRIAAVYRVLRRRFAFPLGSEAPRLWGWAVLSE